MLRYYIVAGQLERSSCRLIGFRNPGIRQTVENTKVQIVFRLPTPPVQQLLIHHDTEQRFSHTLLTQLHVLTLQGCCLLCLRSRIIRDINNRKIKLPQLASTLSNCGYSTLLIPNLWAIYSRVDSTGCSIIFYLLRTLGLSPEGPVSQIHSPHLHVGAPGIFSDPLRSDAVERWGAESNGKLPHLSIPR